MTEGSFDAIVIGSGAGGCAAAYQLVQADLRVALLEKGDHLPQDGTTLDIDRVVHQGAFLSREVWQAGAGQPLTPEEHFNVGGKTKWYGAALLRFGDHEFLADPEHGCSGWPISARELTPYYTQAETLLGVRFFACERNLAGIVTRLQRVDAGWRAQPLPLALAPGIASDAREASHFDGFASAAGFKGEAEQSLLRPLREHPGLSLCVNAEVTALLPAPGEPTRVRGARLADGRELHAPHVLLAAGALHSPRLLARYLATYELEARLPMAVHVGRRLKLHLLSAVLGMSVGAKTDLLRKTVLLTHDEFPHSSVQPLGFDGELISTLMPRAVPRWLRRQLGRRAYGFFLQTEDGNHAQNRVIEGDAPVLDYHERRLPAAAREHRALVRAVRRSLLLSGFLTFARRIGVEGTAHVCGTLPCGKDAGDSAVDAWGRVHGMQGLYVVDGSVLPRISRVNPSLTIYAWALRVADFLARGHTSVRRSPG
jgi:choline dehydrogenase-like flavoprotein